MTFSLRTRLTCIVFVILYLAWIKSESVSEEDRYVNHFGNDPLTSNEWTTVKKWFKEHGQLKLKKFCSQAHELSGSGSFLIGEIKYKTYVLSFDSLSYLPMKVPVLEYRLLTKNIPLDVKEYMNLNDDERWYITQGLREDCIYYLKLLSYTTMEFNLHKPVCGLKIQK